MDGSSLASHQTSKTSRIISAIPLLEDSVYMSKEYSEVTATVARTDIAVPDCMEGLGPSMRELERVIRELAKGEVPVLLLGERGAGKLAVAEKIHRWSGHEHEPFQTIACATVTPDLFRTNGSDGPFSRGTLYWAELGDLSLECQALLFKKLPSAEENGHAKQPGARMICGSNRDLEAEMKGNRLREDLYYRISGVCLRLPPLRQRKEDIPYLMSFFLAKYAQDFRRAVPKLSEQTQRLFQEYSWPGNIQELEDAAKAIVALGNEAVAMGGLRSLLTSSDRNGNGERVSLKQASRAASREAEKELILKVLDRTRWNRRRAAQELQISYKALLYKLKQIGYRDYGAS
jgi:two-component system response regulator AtoC